MKLGIFIKRQRVSRGITSKELSNSVNVSQAYISMIESNLTTPTPDKVVLIAKSLFLDPEWLLRVAARDEVEIATKKIKNKWLTSHETNE